MVMGTEKSTLDELRIDRSTQTDKPFPKWLMIVVLFLVVAGAVAWGFLRSKPVEVRTALVRDAAGGTGGNGARTVLNASGYVTARRQATVSSKVTGKVVEVLVEEGKRVEAGQILARVDDMNIKASLRLAEAQLSAAKFALHETHVRLKEADLQLKRTADLAKSNIATQADLDHAEAEAHSLKARLEKQHVDVTVAEREVAVWQQQLDDTVIRAPFAGIVTSKNAQPGEMISPMSAGGFTRTGICTIVDMTSLEIEIDVSESYINRVEPGQPVEAKLDAYPDWTISCKVIAIIPTADRQKATVKVRVGFDKLDPRILPDMAAKVAFRGSETGGAATSRAVTVPRAVVQSVDGRDVVFVVYNDRVERRAVTVSVSRDDEVVIASGLTAGERVIISAPKDLADGAAVRESKP
jgi:HlyD family secretion protein